MTEPKTASQQIEDAAFLCNWHGLLATAREVAHRLDAKEQAAMTNTKTAVQHSSGGYFAPVNTQDQTKIEQLLSQRAKLHTKLIDILHAHGTGETEDRDGERIDEMVDRLAKRLDALASAMRDREHQWMFGVSVQEFILQHVNDVLGDETMLDALRRWKAERDAKTQASVANTKTASELVEDVFLHLQSDTERRQACQIIVQGLSAKIDAHRMALESIEEYWNGAADSALDAAEEMKYRASSALDKLLPHENQTANPMSDIPTPITDAEAIRLGGPDYHYFVARQLERELAAKDAEIADLRKRPEPETATLLIQATEKQCEETARVISERDVLVEQIAAITKERDEAKAEILQLKSDMTKNDACFMEQNGKYLKMLSERDAALAANAELRTALVQVQAWLGGRSDSIVLTVNDALSPDKKETKN